MSSQASDDDIRVQMANEVFSGMSIEEINKMTKKESQRLDKVIDFAIRLFHQHTATAVDEALDNRDKTVKLTVGVVLTPYIGKYFMEYYDEYKKYDQELNRTGGETDDE